MTVSLGLMGRLEFSQLSVSPEPFKFHSYHRSRTQTAFVNAHLSGSKTHLPVIKYTCFCLHLFYSIIFDKSQNIASICHFIFLKRCQSVTTYFQNIMILTANEAVCLNDNFTNYTKHCQCYSKDTVVIQLYSQ